MTALEKINTVELIRDLALMVCNEPELVKRAQKAIEILLKD